MSGKYVMNLTHALDYSPYFLSLLTLGRLN